MSWTSSTAVIGTGTNGVTSTTSNNALIVGDGVDAYTFGCNANSKLTVEVNADVWDLD